MNVAATFRKNTSRGSLIRTSAGRYSPAYNAGVQIYTGEHEFVDTTMLLKVDHEIAPKEQALGKNLCDDCHLAGQIDWQGLGWTGNPVSGGTRQTAAR